MRAMPGRLVLLVALYVALDFANPLMPGAVCFDAGDTVDGVRGQRPRVTAVPAVVPPVRYDVVPEPRVHAPVPRLSPVPPLGREAFHPRRLPPATPAEAASGDH